MINIIIILIVGLFLAFISYLDIKHKEIPSVYTTTVILFLLVYNMVSTPLQAVVHLYLLIIGFVFAYLLTEIDFIRGVADIKVIIIISLIMSQGYEFVLFIILLAGVNIIYQSILKSFFNYKYNDDIPFIPVFLIVYIILVSIYI